MWATPKQFAGEVALYETPPADEASQPPVCFGASWSLTQLRENADESLACWGVAAAGVGDIALYR